MANDLLFFFDPVDDEPFGTLALGPLDRVAVTAEIDVLPRQRFQRFRNHVGNRVGLRFALARFLPLQPLDERFFAQRISYGFAQSVKLSNLAFGKFRLVDSHDVQTLLVTQFGETVSDISHGPEIRNHFREKNPIRRLI